jgi:hypothetical protein
MSKEERRKRWGAEGTGKEGTYAQITI